MLPEQLQLTEKAENMNTCAASNFETLNGKGNVLKIFGNDYNTKDGTCIRDYIHVKDVAEAHILAMKNLEVKVNGKYNLGSGTGFSNLEVINAVEKVTGKKVNWQF